MKNSDFTALGELLPRTIHHYNLSRQVKGALVCHHFRRLAVGLWDDSIEECVRPVSFRDGVLKVAVCDSGWAQQVHFKREALLKGLGDACPDIPLKGLRVSVETFLS